MNKILPFTILLTAPFLRARADNSNTSVHLNSNATYKGANEITVGETIIGISPVTQAQHVTLGHVQGTLELTQIATINKTYSAAISHAVYPNPTAGTLYVSMPDDAQAEISITALNGAKLIKGTYTGPTATLNISSLANGIYMLTIITDNQLQYSAKIIKH